MSTLGWIIVLGIAMSGIAMVGSTTLMLSERALDRLLIPLVALAAGSMLGVSSSCVETSANGEPHPRR